MVGDCSSSLLCHILGGAFGKRSGVSEDLDPQVDYPAFSSWPPNCLRMAESTLPAKSSRPREAKRE